MKTEERACANGKALSPVVQELLSNLLDAYHETDMSIVRAQGLTWALRDLADEIADPPTCKRRWSSFLALIDAIEVELNRTADLHSAEWSAARGDARDGT